MSECPLGAGPEFGVRPPPRGSRGPRYSGPARVLAPTPSPASARAQPSPVRIRFRTLAATAKDRRTPHHRLKIRPRVWARALKGRRALPGPGGGAGAPAQHGGLNREFGFGMRGAPQAERNAGVAAGTEERAADQREAKAQRLDRAAAAPTASPHSRARLGSLFRGAAQGSGSRGGAGVQSELGQLRARPRRVMGLDTANSGYVLQSPNSRF
uniref:Uncharacterized protein n=1 Tax=Rangifer tarandus platyrhynchus TaxID=3082113 RepID=A0ACB0EWR4_RANTA|nr:unnamed protein product [Rangifer tarandus platyrhynchus]